ncbi:hypothetical protein MRX96_002235 [Rhipicephalus microplus]
MSSSAVTASTSPDGKELAPNGANADTHAFSPLPKLLPEEEKDMSLSQKRPRSLTTLLVRTCCPTPVGPTGPIGIQRRPCRHAAL